MITKKILILAKNTFNKLFPLHRSLGGKDNIKTIKILSKISRFNISYFKMNSKMNDWKIPKEWNCVRATIKNLSNKKILDTKDNNLHIVSHSIPVKNKIIKRKDLLKKIYTLKNKKNTIPYVTSYYKKDWGFCMTHKQKESLKDSKYRINIDSYFSNKGLPYGYKLIKSKNKNAKTILFSTNICHPSMFNNELSGPVLLTLFKKMIENKKLNYNYLFLLLPETIGSIAYTTNNFNFLKENILMGFTITMFGYKKEFMIVKNLLGTSNALNIARKSCPSARMLKIYNFRKKGSDERQYCSANINLDVVGLRRGTSKLFEQYHSSDDNMSLFNAATISQSLKWLKNILKNIEIEEFYKLKYLGEPMLSKRNLYHNISTPRNIISKSVNNSYYVKRLIDIAHLMNGIRSNNEIKNLLRLKDIDFKNLLNTLLKNKIIFKV